MRKLIIFMLDGCPYCKKAMEAEKELRSENPAFAAVEIEWINEAQHPEIVKRYSYYYVPSIFLGGDKLFECQPGDSYEKIKQQVKYALIAATKA